MSDAPTAALSPAVALEDGPRVGPPHASPPGPPPEPPRDGWMRTPMRRPAKLSKPEWLANIRFARLAVGQAAEQNKT